MDWSEDFESLPGADPEHLREELLQSLAQAKDLPLGPERLATIARLAEQAGANGLAEVELRARIDQTWDAFEAGLTSLGFSALAWSLGEFWRQEAKVDPALTAEMVRQLLWVPQLAARNPAVSRQVIARLEGWMEYFTAHADLSATAGWQIRYQVELGLGHREKAHEALVVCEALERLAEAEAVTTAASAGQEVDGELTCPLHRWRPQIVWEAKQGNYLGALQLAQNAQLEAQYKGYECRQPQDLDPVLMLPLAWTGAGTEAWRAHLSAYRHQVETSQFLGDIASHLRYCEATWNLAEGLEILGAHAQWFAAPEDPWDLLTAARAAAALLQRGSEVARAGLLLGDKLGFTIPGSNPWRPFPTLTANTSLEQAATVLRRLSLQLAADYDLRNGNDTVSRRTLDVLSAPPVCPLSEIKPLLRGRYLRSQAWHKLGLAALRPEILLPEGILAGDDPVTAPTGLAETSATEGQKTAQTDPAGLAGGEEARLLLEAAAEELGLDFAALCAGQRPPAESLLHGVVAPGLSAEAEILAQCVAQCAYLAATGQWAAAITCAELAREVGQELGDNRHTLSAEIYRVQALWMQGRRQDAREALIAADELVDASCLPQVSQVLDDLSLLAG